MDKSETRVEISGKVTGARYTGMRDNAGRRLRELFVLVTEEDAQELSFDDKLIIRRDQ